MDDNIRDFDDVVEENKRLKQCVDVLIKLIEECGLGKEKESEEKREKN